MKISHSEKIMRKLKPVSLYVATIFFISILFSGCASKAHILNVQLSKNNLNKKVYVKNDYNNFKKSEYITILDIKNGIYPNEIKMQNLTPESYH
jgi:hypothetical protein